MWPATYWSQGLSSKEGLYFEGGDGVGGVFEPNSRQGYVGIGGLEQLW